MTQLLNVVRVKQEFVEAKVGDGATIVMWTDRHAATVIAVSKSGKSAVIQEDKAIRLGKMEMSESQQYTFEKNPNGAVHKIQLTNKGWRIGGQRGTKVLIGVRDEYYDYNF